MSRRPLLGHWLLSSVASVTIALAACAPAAPAAPTAAPAKPAEATKPAAASPAAAGSPAAASPAAASSPAASPAAASSPAASPGASPAASPAGSPAAKPAGVAPTSAPLPAPAAKANQTGVATLKAPANKRDLIVATAADISKLDPQLSTSVQDIVVTFNLYDTLTSRDPDLKLIPRLATEWKATNDTTWEFKLRSDAKFHNGDPVTSADVKFTIERSYDPEAKTLVATVFTTVASIATPDPQTVVVTTKQPDPLFPARLAFYGGQIMPKTYYERVGADEFNAKPIGSGPVKFTEWIKDDRLVLDANKEYWGGAPDFDRVVFRPIPEAQPRLAALQAGEADMALKLLPDQVDQLNRSERARPEGALYAGEYVLAVNAKVAPLDNPKIKQALSLAIDRDGIVKALWRGQGVIPNGFIAPGDSFYDPSRPAFEYNLNKAKALLAEAGYKNEPIYIESSTVVGNDRQMSEAIAEMWKQAGVNAQLELIEGSVRAQKNREKSFKGVFWSDPTSTLQDPDGMMYRLLGPGGPQDYWRDADWDRLGAEARFSLDPAVRERNYKQMQDIMAVNFPWLPVIVPIESHGVARYLNFRPNPNQTIELRKEVLTFNR